MINIIFSLLPPILTLFLVFFTGNVITALSVGVLSSAFIVAKYSPLKTIKIAIWRVISVLELNHLSTFQGFFA